MRSRSVAVTAVLITLLLGGAGAVYAYDSGREDTIAEGIRIGGVPVGGLTPTAATSRLEADLLPVLREPIRVHHDTSTWTLGPREAKIEVDLASSVQEAVLRSRRDGIITRTWRGLTGGKLDADITPTVSYSKDAVVRLLDKVRSGIDRPVKEARITYTASGIGEVDGRRGLKTRASELHQQIRQAIVSRTASRRLVAQTEKIEPKTTRDDLAKKNPTILIVDRGSFTLKVYKKLKLVKTYKVAVGAAGHDTPTGLYSISNKAVNPAWNVPHSDWAGDLAGQVIPGGAPNNPLKSRWLGIYDGVGIHGTDARNSIGSNASKGCLRMLVEDVEELYPQVPVGAPIYIA